MNKRQLFVVTGLVLVATLTRLIPHPYNFTPITAIALFGGAHFADKRLAFLIPLLAMFASDLLIGFHSLMPLTYLCFSAIVLIGFLLRGRQSFVRIAGGTLSGSLLFFVVTNLGVWLFDGIYPMTAEGLVACYVAAIPFFQNTVLGDAAYALFLFGGFAVLARSLPALREPVFASR